MERYFRYEAAGDQFVGRIVAGLPINSGDFSVLPPHFGSGHDHDVDFALKTMFPSLANAGPMLGILRVLLASLVHHSNYLATTLPHQHTLLSTYLFTDPDLASKLRSKIIYGSSTNVIQPTGIPPHVELYRKLDAARQQILDLPDSIIQGIGRLLEEKGVMAGNITREIMEQMLAKAIQTLTNQCRPSVCENRGSTINQESPKYPLYQWGNKLHVLPESFDFPNVDVFTAWNLWWLGNPMQNTIPYKKIQLVDLSTQAKKNALAEWKFLIEKGLCHHLKVNCNFELDGVVSRSDVLSSFELLKPFIDSIVSHSTRRQVRRPSQLKVMTMARLFREMVGPKTHRPFAKRVRRTKAP
ncbi:hypothetical protein AeRB84_008162 [Aphanomyces euteiches]|nr:hypothetical protein AeRB84_008162 [Aphanomyces euteiches]